MASPHYSGSTAGVDSDELLVEANGSTRTLILNRPKKLNALSSTMIKELLRCFIAYQKDDGVKLLILKGKGRAFCAGGDVVVASQAILDVGWTWGADLYGNQYFLNYIIASSIKPLVSLLTGIVMGGGAGVPLHGRFRVVTEKTVFAMPETALGEYVALAGARLDGAEMLACGLATHFVRSNRLPLLEESLKKVDTSNAFVVCGIIDQFAEHPSLKENSSLKRLEIINKCFSKRTIEEIISALEQVASNMADEWVTATIQSLKKASPTSLKTTLRSVSSNLSSGVSVLSIRI